MEKVATDIYSFRNLRKSDYTYVDKTAMLLPLADDSIGRQFFLARPRRFGKSLPVATLHCLFEGRRELFKGLAIEPEWGWSKTWPVLHLDMGTIDIDQSALEAYEPENPRLVTLPYQTGCLTIKSFRQTGLIRRFDLCIPNLEVENSFLTQLAPVSAGIDADRSTDYQFAATQGRGVIFTRRRERGRR